LIPNIYGIDWAIDKWKMTLSTTIFSTFDENNYCELWSINEKNDHDLEIQ